MVVVLDHPSQVPHSCHQTAVCLLLLLLVLMHRQGGSPWGAGTLAGPDGSRQPSEAELEQAVFQVRPQTMRVAPHPGSCVSSAVYDRRW
jgi:hypothetical protein